jgi:hypothetical protein
VTAVQGNREFWRIRVEKHGGDRDLYLWGVDDGKAFRLFDDKSCRLPDTIAPWPRALDAVKAKYADQQVTVGKACLPPGVCHQRTWRPGASPAPQTWFAREWAGSLQSASSLFDGMRRVFRVVEPSGSNLTAFGHEVRQLLLLACMEVESACRAVLRANGYAPTGKQGKPRPIHSWNVNDYVRLVRPLHLDEWHVALVGYPDLNHSRPFEGWSPQHVKLPWYDAYNATKHNREDHLNQATLQHMIDAMAAVFVIICAQFGRWMPGAEEDFLSLSDSLSVQRNQDFTIAALPRFELSEHYVPDELVGGRGWKILPYDFR